MFMDRLNAGGTRQPIVRILLARSKCDFGAFPFIPKGRAFQVQDASTTESREAPVYK